MISSTSACYIASPQTSLGFVCHAFISTNEPQRRNECVTNEPQRTSAGRLRVTYNERFHIGNDVLPHAEKLNCVRQGRTHIVRVLSFFSFPFFFFFFTRGSYSVPRILIWMQYDFAVWTQKSKLKLRS